MPDNVRLYLAATLDSAILNNDSIFADAKRDFFDNPRASLSPNIYLFDEQHYLSLRGILRSSMTPIRDYFEYGAYLGITPHPLVQPDHVRRQLTASMGDTEEVLSINPLTAIFCLQNRTISPNIFFEIDAYKNYVESVCAINTSFKGIGLEHPIIHYINNWRSMQEVLPLLFSEFFDPRFYNLQADRQGHELNDPLSNYLEKPLSERFDCNPRFHGGYYRHLYTVKNMDPLQHFLQVGAKRANLPNPYASYELGLEHLTAPPDIIEKILLDYTRIKKLV